MTKSKIEWCTKTWPLLYGCAKVSAGCDHCYASHRWVKRFQENPKLPDLYGKHIVDKYGEWTGKIVMLEHNLDWPLRIRKPQRIFVNPFSDLFHYDVPVEFIAKVFAVMALAPGHRFMVLTKRPMRMSMILNDKIKMPHADSFREEVEYQVKNMGYSPIVFDWPLSNFWPGVSIENQLTADQRIPHLLKTPAAGRFVSYEPALGARVHCRKSWKHQCRQSTI